MKKRPITIAIIDNQAIYRNGIVSVINKFENFEVIFQSHSIDLFLKEFPSTQPLPDICIVGINSPQINSYAELESIKQEHPVLKILVLSIYNHDLNLIGLRQYDVNGFLSKNADAKELLKALLTIHYTGHYDDEFNKALKGLAKAKLPLISEREAAFLELLCLDLSNTEITERLGINNECIDSYTNILCDKLNVKSKIGLIVSAHIMGITC